MVCVHASHWCVYMSGRAGARCGELVAQVLAAPPDASVVRLVDDISDEVRPEAWLGLVMWPGWQRAVAALMCVAAAAVAGGR